MQVYAVHVVVCVCVASVLSVVKCERRGIWCVDGVVPLQRLGAALVRLTYIGTGAGVGMSTRMIVVARLVQVIVRDMIVWLVGGRSMTVTVVVRSMAVAMIYGSAAMPMVMIMSSMTVPMVTGSMAWTMIVCVIVAGVRMVGDMTVPASMLMVVSGMSMVKCQETNHVDNEPESADYEQLLHAT